MKVNKRLIKDTRANLGTTSLFSKMICQKDIASKNERNANMKIEKKDHAMITRVQKRRKYKFILISAIFTLLMLPGYAMLQASLNGTIVTATVSGLGNHDITNSLNPITITESNKFFSNQFTDKWKNDDVNKLLQDSNISTPRDVSAEPKLPETLDVGKLFQDNLAGYQKVWEPWLSKAAIHDIEISEDGDYFLVGGGYLYDNEIHVYRWNDQLKKYVRVWETGDQIIGGDIFSVTIGDTDNNNFVEVAGASADGYVYVFEQKHIYDPFTRTENRFDLVWKSPYLKQAWAVQIADTDKDFIKDLIVASWDGYIRWYEYRDHSGYPFSKEHWIEYREVFKAQVKGHPQSLAVTDLNGNGLDEVIVGTREGWIQVFENNGTVIDIEGQPFPLSRDNNYQLIWENNESIWYPIMKMDTGQLDDDRAQEVVLTARGQGVYVLDYDPEIQQFVLSKLTTPLESWEAPATGAGYPLDHYVDWMTRSSGNVRGWDGRPEPDPNNYADSPTIYPYNTSMARKPDNNYTLFDASASGTVASAVLDFGKDEELTGDGRPGAPESQRGYDLYVYFSPTTPPIPSRMTFYVSADGENWEQIPDNDLLALNTTMLLINVDTALSKKQWSGARYLNITVHSNGYFKIDAIWTRLLDRPLDTATSAIIGQVNRQWDVTTTENNIIVGTVMGKILAYHYDSEKGTVTKIFDSYGDERYVLGGNVWDIEQIPTNKPTIVPTFLAIGNNFVANLTQQFGGTPTYPDGMTWAKLHQLSDVKPASPEYINQKDLVIFSKGTAAILRGDDYQAATDLTNRYLININLLGASSLSIAFSTQTKDNLYGIPYLAAVAYTPGPEAKFYNPKSPSEYSNVRLSLYRITNPSSAYTHVADMPNLESTRYIETILKKSQTLPTMAFGDLDKDGFEDLIIANGKLYLLKNRGATYYLDQEYFKDINAKSSEIFTNPQIVDFDQDGDYDLVLSYKGKPGIAYWINTGTPWKPRWEFRRQDLINLNAETNFAYNNLTLFTVEHGQYLNETQRIATFQTHSTLVGIFQADFETHDSFLVGVNPKIARVDLNLRSGTDKDGIVRKNFGYRILETWNTEGELKQWTQSISIADLDGDGRREVIAGDFDNNIYVFEHLTNNTYKRAYRSPDLAQKINTTQSPYAHEQLLGISASFIRFEWQHVNLLTAGSDLDRDGRTEFIATSGLTIYVFEYLGRDDHYQLVWSTNLADTIWKSVFDYLGITEFTALRTSADMNYNGYGELLAAAGPFLFIFESQGDNVFREIFMDSSLRALLPGAHYYLPENGLLYFYVNYDGSKMLTINDIAVGNFIKDTPEQEIIVVGEISTIWGQKDGFGYIMRNVGSTFYHLGEFDERLVKNNPINAIEVDDPDYDGHPDLIIGHDKGVDVVEIRSLTPEEQAELGGTGPDSSPPSFQFNVQARLTGSPNHPYISPLYALNNESVGAVFPPNIYQSETFLQFVLDYGVIFNVDRIDERSTEILALHTSLGLPGYPDYMNAGDLIQVFSKDKRLHWAYSWDNGSSWIQKGQLFTNNDYKAASIIGAEGVVVSESDPALYQAPNGNVYLAFSIFTYDLPTSSIGSAIILAKKYFDPTYGNISSWTIVDAVVSVSDISTGVIYGHPSVWMDATDPLAKQKIGISYMNTLNSTVYFARFSFGVGVSGPTTDVLNIVPFIGIGANRTFRAYSVDALYQTHGFGAGRYVLAFSGEKYSEAKGDADIWITTADLEFNWTNPVRVSNSQTTDAYPDLTQLLNAQGTLMVTWEIQERTLQGEIGVSYSKDGGLTWREPDTLASIPEFMEFRYFPLLGIALPTWKLFPSVVFGNFLITSPTITALPFGGFTYAFIASYTPYLLQVLPVDSKLLKTSAAYFGSSSQNVVKLIPLSPPEADYSLYRREVGPTPSRTVPTGSVSYSLPTLGYQSLSAISDGLNAVNSNTVSGTISAGTFVPILGQVTAEEILNIQQFDTISTLSTAGENNDEDSTETPSTGDYASTNMPTAYVATKDKASTYPSKVDGVYRNIFVGRNFGEYWLDFDFFEASNIAVGDSDGDGFREIALTSRDRAYLVEMTGNTKISKFYRQTWASQSFDVPLTDIALFDANGNGFEEIIISGEGGNVFSFEIDDLTLTQANLQFLTVNNVTKLNWDAVPDATVQTLASFDVDGNGLDELIVADLIITNTPRLRLFVDGDPNAEINTTINGLISSFNYLDFNDDGLIDILSIGTINGNLYNFNLTATLITESFQGLNPTTTLNEKIVKILYLENTAVPLNWTEVVIDGDSVQLYQFDSNNAIWTLQPTDLTGNTLIGGTIGTFLNSNGLKSIAVVDDRANIILIEPDSANTTIINDFDTGGPRNVLLESSDLNDDGIDDLIIALDNQQLIAFDVSNRSILWTRGDEFSPTEVFKAIRTTDLDNDGSLETYLVSDSGFDEEIETTFRTSFETDPLTGYPLWSGLSLNQVNLTNVQSIIGGAEIADSYNFTSITYLGYGYPYPTDGNNVLIGPTDATTGEFGLVFKNLVSRIRFRIIFDSTLIPIVQLFENQTFTAPIHQITLNLSKVPQTLEFLASDFNLDGFKAIRIIPNGSPQSFFWYLDELEYDVLQPSVFIRQYDEYGNLERRTSLGAQRVNSFIINDNPEGIISPVGLMGLSVDDGQVVSSRDVRGFLGFDLMSGHPTFYGNVQLSASTGITGTMQDRTTGTPHDGVFFLEDGTMFTFQFIDLLNTETLDDVSMTVESEWGYKLSSPVKFVKAVDLNGDGIEDIVAATTDGYVYALDGNDSMNVLWKTRLNPRPVSVVIGDFVKQLGTPDVFIAFADGTYLVLNGSSGLTAWRGLSVFHQPTTALNSGDRDGDGFDDIFLGTKFKYATITLGSVIHLSGSGDGSGNKKIIDTKYLGGPAKKMELASDGTNDYLIVLSLGGYVPFSLVSYQVTTGGVLNLDGYNASYQFLDFAVMSREPTMTSGEDSIIAVTLDAKVIVANTLTDFAAGNIYEWYSLSDVVGRDVVLPHMMQPLDTLTWDPFNFMVLAYSPDGYEDTLVIGLEGFGYVAIYIDGFTPDGSLVAWIFEDASIRNLVTRDTATVDYYPDADGILDIITTNAEIAYILNGTGGNLRWITSLPYFTGDILALDTVTMNGKEKVIIGTELGYILRFDLNNTVPTASLPIYVPWYSRYQNVPVTPSALLPPQEESENATSSLKLQASTVTLTNNIQHSGNLVTQGKNLISNVERHQSRTSASHGLAAVPLIDRRDQKREEFDLLTSPLFLFSFSTATMKKDGRSELLPCHSSQKNDKKFIQPLEWKVGGH